jgi:hypothetical protein
MFPKVRLLRTLSVRTAHWWRIDGRITDELAFQSFIFLKQYFSSQYPLKQSREQELQRKSRK